MPASAPDGLTDVYLYATCLVDMFHPQAGLDTVAVLESFGLRVHFPPDQTCCGQPAYTSGYAEDAKAVARAQLDLFPEPWPVVIPSGSCAGMMRHHYPRLFADDAALLARVNGLAARLYELSEFLFQVLKLDESAIRAAFGGAPIKLALHTSCSARRETAAFAETRKLLGWLPQLELRIHDHESECCGFGGTFSLRSPDISGAMAGDKLEALKACGAEGFVTGDCGCLLNLNHSLAARKDEFQGQHLASLLRQRLKGERP